MNKQINREERIFLNMENYKKLIRIIFKDKDKDKDYLKVTGSCMDRGLIIFSSKGR